MLTTKCSGHLGVCKRKPWKIDCYHETKKEASGVDSWVHSWRSQRWPLLNPAASITARASPNFQDCKNSHQQIEFYLLYPKSIHHVQLRERTLHSGLQTTQEQPYGTEICLLQELHATGALCPCRQAGNAEELFYYEVQSSLVELDPEAAHRSISSCPGCEFRAAQLRLQLHL